MSDKTNIQWCDSTWSPWLGCSKVSPGCKNCYITETTPFRTRGLKHGQPRQRTSASYWKQPLKWNRMAVCLKCGEMEYVGSDDCRHCGQNFNMRRKPRIFPSLCDWLDEEVPIEWLADFLRLIHETPNLDWLLLTKRPEKFADRLHAAMRVDPAIIDMDDEVWISGWLDGDDPENVWIGVSVEDQARADERIPELLKIPARIRFLSAEPLLGPVRLKFTDGHAALPEGVEPPATKPIHWVIVGGESGPGARPCNIDWIRHVVRQCRNVDVPCFVKQVGSYSIFDFAPGLPQYAGKLKDSKGGDPGEWPEDLRWRQWPNGLSAKVVVDKP